MKRRLVPLVLGIAATTSATLSGLASARGDAAAPQSDATQTAEDTRARIGLDQVEARRGRQTPTGRGVVIAHVEGGAGEYLPQVMAEAFAGVRFEALSGPGKSSGHADATARILYGRRGLAPGVERVLCLASNHWLREAGLRTGTSHPPRATDARVMTHSWIAGGSPFDAQMLRRLDHLADTQGVVVVAGVNNNPRSPVPALLACAYNVIAVGQWDGKSSGGYTTAEVEGRCKPDLVAPGSLTSFSTPVVAAVAARLLEAADRTNHPWARRPEVIKAALLAGAEKPANWQPASGKPLDEHLGAGRVRLDRSLEILEAAGPTSMPAALPAALAGDAAPDPGQSPQAKREATLRNRCGWVMGTIANGGRHEFTLDTPRDLGEASIVLVWHRRIDGRTGNDLLTGEPIWLDTPRLANLDLDVDQRDAAGATRQMARSASAIDNVEHVSLAALPAARYTLRVTREDRFDEAWTYALAWWVAAR